ncbi:MAG: hypothetical protein HOC23_12270 [Halieaceae bacterium]|nr:hypothetical protein [Halieaceae bacterium]
MNTIIRLLLIIVVFTPLVSCKLRITVSNGGYVISTSGEHDCATGSKCTIEIEDFTFDQTFQAVPNPGFIFVQWRRGTGHFCGGSTEPCRLYNSPLEAYPAIAGIIATDDFFYLQPIFVDLATAMLGSWSGEWNNTTFGSSGAITMTIAATQDGGLQITSDIDGNVFGMADPPEMTFTVPAPSLGDGTFDQTFSFAGNELHITGSMSATGEFSASMDLSSLGMASFEIEGTIRPSSFTATYTVNFASGDPATGTILITKD